MSRARFEGWPAQAIRVTVAELAGYCDRNGYAFPISADASALVETVTDRADAALAQALTDRARL